MANCTKGEAGRKVWASVDIFVAASLVYAYSHDSAFSDNGYPVRLMRMDKRIRNYSLLLRLPTGSIPKNTTLQVASIGQEKNKKKALVMICTVRSLNILLLPFWPRSHLISYLLTLVLLLENAIGHLQQIHLFLHMARL